MLIHFSFWTQKVRRNLIGALIFLSAGFSFATGEAEAPGPERVFVKKAETKKVEILSSKKNKEKKKTATAAKPLVEEKIAPNFDSIIDYAQAKKIAEQARKMIRSKRSKKMCLRGVRRVLDGMTAKGPAPTVNMYDLPFDNDPYSSKEVPAKMHPSRSAYNFLEWAKQNPLSLCKTFGLAIIEKVEATPLVEGSILGYGRGSCGFSSKYGHIEIVTDTEQPKACSDHCREIDVSCKPTLVLMPVMTCQEKYASKAASLPGPAKG